jgi:hypothetical protein
MPELEFVLLSGGKEKGIPVGSAPLTFGRGPANTVVVSDDTASWHHAMVWLEAGAAWVKDIGSTNGTFVNGERVHGAHRLNPGDRVRIGAVFELELRGSAGASIGPFAFAVEEQPQGATFPLHSDRFVIGSSGDADIRLPDGPAAAITLLIHAGEVWHGGADDGDRQLAPGETFAVGDRSFLLRALDPTRAPTVTYSGDRYPYRLSATLSGPTGPEATVTDTRTGTRCVLRGNRAVLAYVLGRARLSDLEEQTDDTAGWYDDDSLTTDIWGRTPLSFDANNLNVLVYRTRASLRSAGLEPWCIEKRKGYTRARVASVELGD